MAELKIGDKVYTDADLAKPEVQKEITELASKGLDYTKKTQALSKDREEVDKLKKQFEDPSFQHAAALRDAIMQRPEIAAEIDKIVAKYENGEGGQPEPGSAEDKAKNAEIRALADKVDSLIKANETEKQKAEQAKLQEVYAKTYEVIDGYIGSHGLDGDNAKDVAEMVRIAAFRFALDEGEAGTLTRDSLKAFVDKKVSLFQNPVLLKKAQAQEQTAVVTGNAGGGAPPPGAGAAPKALPGDTGFGDRVKAALEKAKNAVGNIE